MKNKKKETPGLIRQRFRIGFVVLLSACALLALGVSSPAHAQHLVCDPQAGVDYYVITGLPAPIDGSHVLPDPSGKFGCYLSLADMPTVGGDKVWNITAQACTTTDETHLGGCSATVPFVFTQRKVSLNPAGFRLVQ